MIATDAGKSFTVLSQTGNREYKLDDDENNDNKNDEIRECSRACSRACKNPTNH